VIRFLPILILISGAAWAKPKAPPVPAPDWKYTEAQLKKAKFKKSFIKALRETYEARHFQQTVELNVLLFLRKRDDHGVQVSKDAVETVKAFMEANRSSLSAAEKEHGVSSSVIASLLWLESRHGENRGRFHVPSVYLHLLQAPRPDVVAHLKRASHNFAPLITKKNLAEIEARTVKKAAWAVGELKALEKLYAKDPKLVRGLRGSFAGAFGIPQFIPSSYLRWARTQRKSVSPDLNRPQDAIQSVAYYLKDNGWRKGRDKTFVKALMKYNNSMDYAQAILKLAGKVDGRRAPAGQ
jgi:membrane-bound lytic murein transglycosylase B